MLSTSMHQIDSADGLRGPAGASVTADRFHSYAETAMSAGTAIYPLFFTIVWSAKNWRGLGLEGLSR